MLKVFLKINHYFGCTPDSLKRIQLLESIQYVKRNKNDYTEHFLRLSIS